MAILIKNARIIDPSGELDRAGDILVERGKIAAVGENLSAPAGKTIDASGLCVAPGLVDMHVHTREPGYTYKDDTVSVAEAAAAGGVTSFAAMPNTKPVVSSADTIDFIKSKADGARVKVFPVASMVCDGDYASLTDFGELKNAGAIAFSNDGICIPDAKTLLLALQQAEWHGVPLLIHSEDVSLSGGGIINEGVVSAALGVQGMPFTSENVGTARDLMTARSTQANIHLCHVSTSSALETVRFAKKTGVRVTAETCPQYFMLNDELLMLQDADYRCNPPIRSELDRRAVLRAIADGTIDAIATDHAPHSADEKKDFFNAPNGVLGLETSLAAGITALVNRGYITLFKLIYMMSTVPAQILGIDAGSLKEGSNADIALFDPAEKWIVETDRLHGKARNSPFKGMELTGRVKYTLVDGEIVYQD
ncbi:MAG: dihydroorotase [Oscillospiraceae bacterium]|nr:dihydroorotase [Oscillospiraceae bacterium]